MRRRRAGGAGARRGAAWRPPTSALRATPSLLAGMPAGVQVGTFVHRVLEATDFAAPDLDAELAAQVAERARRGAPVDIGDPAAVVAGCARRSRRRSARWSAACACATSRRADRLDELDFELPLGGGDDADRRGSTLDAIAAVLRAHLPAGDPLAGYAERLDDPALRPQRARLPDRQHRPRAAGVGRRGSRSSTTRRTGSARPARR